MILFFGVRCTPPCSDCCGKQCTMNCGPAPQRVEKMLIAANQTVSRGVYGMSIRNAISVPEAFLAGLAERIDRAYDAGEPIWMIAEELRFRYEHRPRPSLSPAQFAVRRVRVGL